MFNNLFDKFRKHEILPVKQKEELEREFANIKISYATIASSQIYSLLKEYYLARLEINRDILEQLNPVYAGNKHKILAAQAENKIIRDFISDIEDMQIIGNNEAQI